MLSLVYSAKLKSNVRILRKGMTGAENLLWSRLRRKQLLDVQFYRQKPVGNYIVDFYAPKANLIAEIDGSQHLEPGHARDDRIRDAYLKRQGLTVLRFENLQVLKKTEAVLEAIYLAVATTHAPSLALPPNPPLLKGGKTAHASERNAASDPALQKNQTKNQLPKKNQTKNSPLEKGGRGDSSGAKNHDEGIS